MATKADIPVVSLAAGRAEAARQFGAALENIGFVTIVDHGVPPD